MAITTGYKNFIPTLWSARLLSHLDNALVALQLVNRDYEGEITAFGDTVKINQIGNVTIKDYTGNDIDAPEELDSTQLALVIDQAKYFNFAVKDIAKAQANVNLMDAAMARAGYGMAAVVDTDIFSEVAAQAGNRVGTTAKAIEVEVANAYDLIVDLGVTLDGKNVPRAGRKLVLPAWYFGLLSKDARFTRNYDILENGVVEGATVGGFQLLMSNNLKKETGDVVHSVGGTTQGMTFANQVVETEAYRPEKNFSDAVKGLNVWGRKVVQPNCLVDFIIKPKA